MDTRWKWVLICAIPFLVNGSASRPLPDGYTRRVWQTQDGLPENTVQAFAEDSDNYLWIGTSGGLVRFDGERFVAFDRENAPAILENSIFCLAVARDGSLWATKTSAPSSESQKPL
jgi:ligand-binding sensor domain-containing protein